MSLYKKNGNGKLRNTRIIGLVPNAVTVTSLCTGLSSIRFALTEEWGIAVSLILIAAVLDALDGKVARLLRASSRFGAELDSLSDFIAFGVAPAVVLYLFSLHEWSGTGWTMALFFSTAQALRLARFNSNLDLPEPPEWMRNYSVGVPAPAGAFIAILPLIASLAFPIKHDLMPALVAFFMGVSALLMVSRIPTFLLKNLRIPNKYVRILLILVALVMASLFNRPWITLTILGVTYILSIPISAIMHKRKKLGKEAEKAGK